MLEIKSFLNLKGVNMLVCSVEIFSSVVGQAKLEYRQISFVGSCHSFPHSAVTLKIFVKPV